MSDEIHNEDITPILNAIDGAEEILDPLDGLIEKSAEDPGAAFTPAVLERLIDLKKGDRGAFEALRARLKKAGCRVMALDEAIAEETGDGRRASTQADILIDLATVAELFHAADGVAFADVTINDHRETWPVRAKGFRQWLARQYFEETGGAPGSEALQSALNVVEAKAHFDGPERPVFIRVGDLDGRLYLDLGDEAWRAVEIDAAGWRVIDNPPVRFRRAAGGQPLPIPARGGSVETLRSFLNVQSDHDFVLVVSWALAALRNRGPYPVIVLSGEQGSAKSAFSAILRALLDPNTAPLRALPREDRDLFIAASNGHALAFDNVSGLPAWMSDTLCRLAAGGGFAVRQLFPDQDEVLFKAARPVILNGIEDIVTRPDLADRAVFLTLEPILEEGRRPEAELWTASEAERPRILGVLLDAVAQGLKRLPDTHLTKLPRMADFALWATACETALWPEGAFWAAYCGNRDEAVIEADPVAAACRPRTGSHCLICGNGSQAKEKPSMTKKEPAMGNEPTILVINDPEDRKGALKTIGGSKSDHWNNTLVNQVAQALWVKNSDGEDRRRQLGAIVAAMSGIAPKDELEGMMAAQLIAAHNAAMECYRRAMINEQTVEGRRENRNQANKLSRTWAAMLDALNKHRGKGQQKVTVEHVHVHAGGQAVVGTIEQPGGGDQTEMEEQPHAKQISHASEPTLRREDAERQAMLVARDAQRPMPDARGQVSGRADR